MDFAKFILPEYPDYYIYPTGHIYSIRNKKYLKPRYDKDGYERFTLRNKLSNKTDTIKTHQLVAMKYLNHTKTNGLVVDHIDNNKLNNSVHNLQLLSPLQNTLKYCYTRIQKNGLPSCITYKIKKKIYVFKLKTPECVYNYECKNLLDCIEKKNEIFKNLIKGKLN